MSERYSVTYSGSNYFQGSFKSELGAKQWATKNIQQSVGCSMLVHIFLF